MLSRRDWIEHLSETEIAEVERATKPLADARVDITAIHRDDFPLPMLGPRLQRILDETLNGRGFALIRCLPVERWTKLRSAIAFFGIGAHMAPRDRRTRRATRSATSKTWGYRASIRTRASTKHANGRPFTRTPVT